MEIWFKFAEAELSPVLVTEVMLYMDALCIENTRHIRISIEKITRNSKNRKYREDTCYTHFLCKKLMSGHSTRSFVAFCDFMYSKFLDSFLKFFLE